MVSAQMCKTDKISAGCHIFLPDVYYSWADNESCLHKQLHCRKLMASVNSLNLQQLCHKYKPSISYDNDFIVLVLLFKVKSYCIARLHHIMVISSS